MRAQDLQEAVRFSKTDYPSVIQDPLLRVGYEIEFIAPWDPSIDINQSQQKIMRKQLPLLLADLETDLGLSVKFNATRNTVNSGTWNLVQDQTIEPNDEKHELGWELVSPPMPIKQSLMHLKQIFSWIRENGYYANHTCGFHVNVSYADKTTQADSLKLILLMGEKYLADLFDRATNRFAASHIQELQAKIRKNPQIVLTADTDIQQLKTQLRKLLSQEKNRTVNLGKQATRGYLEFRIAGGENYHQRFDEIENMILRYGFVLKASLDPDSFKREYTQELAKLITNARNQEV